jgi:hypothetical protein
LCLNKAAAHPGVGIVMDSKGNVFYTDLEQVWKISPDGARSLAVENVHTHELYLDEDDNLYGEHEWYNGEATDTWGNYVWCLSNTGILEKIIEDVDGFIDNDTLIRDLEGNSYWAQKSGDFELLIKDTPGGENSLFTDHQFKDIRWMYYSKSDQNLYVVDHLKVKKVTPAGSVSIIADDLKEAKRPFNAVADRHYVFGIWTDTENNVYTAVYGAGKVKKIGPGGKIRTVFESTGWWSPCGGMVTPDGSQWIMEFSRNNKTRVRKISAEGKQTLYKS